MNRCMYNLKQNVKELFRPVMSSNVVVADGPAEDDVELLRHLVSVRLTSTPSGRFYYYFFVSDKDWVDVAQAVLERNGIRACKHISRIECVKSLVLRIPKKVIDNNANLKKFMEQIQQEPQGNFMIETISSLQNRLQSKQK